MESGYKAVMILNKSVRLEKLSTIQVESSDSVAGGRKAGSLHSPESLTTTFWVFTTWVPGFR